MKALLAALLILANVVTTHAKLGETLVSHIAVSRSKVNAQRFVFSVCQANQCERLGSERGYSEQQIEKLSGTLQMVGASVMGVGEGLVVIYLGASGAAIGAGYMSFGALVGGGVVGAGVPLTAIKMIKSINPVRKFRNGSAQNKIEGAVEKLIASGDASVVLYKNTDLKKTLELASRVDGVLGRIDSGK